MTRIVTHFDKTSTADEVAAGMDLHERSAIVTGAASGIGIETVRALARVGAAVTLAVRDVEAGRRVADDIARDTGNAQLQVAALDLLDRVSIAAFVDQWHGPLHLLINNAGIMACPQGHTREGWELQFATNHLGHFALALGLHRALAAADGARIVSVSSSGHLASPVMFDDLHFERRAYDPWKAYGQSKTANVLFAVEATARWADDGIVANALMPGGIMTNLQKHVSQATKDKWIELEKAGKFFFKTPQQGAATSLVAAVAPELAGIGGRYLEDCNEAGIVENDAPADRGVRRWALDPDAAKQLWDVSMRLLDGSIS